MDYFSSIKREKTDDLEVTGISRSGRVRKKSSKLLDFESDDLNESKFKRQKAQQQHQAYQLLEKFEQQQKLQAINSNNQLDDDHQQQKENDLPQVHFKEEIIENSTSENEEHSSESEGENNTFVAVNNDIFNAESQSDGEDEEEDEDEDEEDEDEEDEEVDPLLIKEAEVYPGFQRLEPPKPKVNKSVYMLEKYNRKLVIKDGKVVSSKTKTQRKDKGKSRFTAYMLWAKEARQNLLEHNPTLDFATMSKRLGELWATVPNPEKYNWKRRAKRLNVTPMNQGLNEEASKKPGQIKQFINRTGLKDALKLKNSIEIGTQAIAVDQPSLIKSDSANSKDLEDSQSSPGVYKVIGTQPIDVAAYLKLLGESLTIIGERLKEHEGQITISGSLPLLLDSLLCALGPLICLTQQIPEMNGAKPDRLANTLENVAYIMPGL